MLELSRGDDSLVVAPEHGGAIVGWTRAGTHLLRRPAPEAVMLGTMGAMACFPLVPFCNRVANRRFAWEGRTYGLAANFGDHPHTIHGVGWQRAWTIEDVSPDSVTLSLRHDASGDQALGWPFAFDARLTWRLSDQGLTIRIAAINRHSGPAPMGIGAHPYFARTADAMIAFQADGVWINRDSLPVANEPIPPAWDHAKGRPADREPLDNCFTGWDGVARIPGMTIAADPLFRQVQVYTPAGRDFFCVEPVTHAPNAINRADLPAEQAMRVLAPGDTLTGSITLTPDRRAGPLDDRARPA